MKYDSDSYCRYEATQKIYESLIHHLIHDLKEGKPLVHELPQDFKTALGELLKDESIDHSFKSYLLEIPSEGTMAQDILHPSFDHIHLACQHLKKSIGLTFQDWFLSKHIGLSQHKKFELTPEAYGIRALKNQALNFLVASESQAGLSRLEVHYHEASNMTEEIFGLVQFIKKGVSLDHESIQKFYKKWGHDSLVMLKWFGALASYSPAQEALGRIEKLQKDPLFLNQVPNYLRALYVQFARNNLVAFHQFDGSGYEFISQSIIAIDKFNPQVASRTSGSFSMINRLDDDRKRLMKTSLEKIMKSSPSRDTYEVVSKYLTQ
jgi:aminopeptidase N